MNGVDIVLVVILAGCAVRGWWRGLFRECFGLIALVVGVAAALRLSGAVEAALQPRFHVPAPVAAGVAFVSVFVVVHGTINVVGMLLSRLAARTSLGVVNSTSGAVLGAAKGGVVLAFVLLFLHLFPVTSLLDPKLMASSIGRSLVAVASNAIRVGATADSASRP